MFKKIILFLTLSFLSFASGEEALKNALDRLHGGNDLIQYDIRTAKALYQPNEQIVTIPYKEIERSGYTKEIGIGEEYSCYITLFKGYEYVIVGAGDNNVSDVDIFIYDQEGNTVSFDRNPDPTAYALLPKDFSVSKSAKIDKTMAGTEISIRPTETQKFLVTVKLRSSKTPKSSVAFLVATKWLK